MEDYSDVWLICYIIAWACLFIYYQKKRRIFDGGSILILLYLIYAVFSFFLYKYYEGYTIFKGLTVFPFVYLFMMLLIAMMPVLKMDSRCVVAIQGPRNNVINLVAFLFIVTTYIGFPNGIKHMQEGLALIFLDSTNAAELYAEGIDLISERGHGSLANLPCVISAAFYEVGVFLFFYLLYKHEKKHVWMIILLGIAIVFGIFTALASGSRGTPIGHLLKIIGSYFLFRAFYSERINKTVKKIGVILAIMIIIPIVAITIGRFGEDNATTSIFDYTGQAVLNFNKYGLDDNGIRYGDRTIPLFKRMVGFRNVPHNYLERRAKYPNLKINDESFSTFVGDFAIDFGPIFTFIIFIISSMVVCSKTKVKQAGIIQFRQLLLLHLVLCICISGGMLYGFSDVGGNLKLIAYFLVYIYSGMSIKKNNLATIENISAPMA